MDLIVDKISNLKLKDNEIYLLRDFSINLFQNDKYILNGKRSTISKGSVHTMINRCKEFCHIHSLKQLKTCPTCVTCNTLTLIGYIRGGSRITEKLVKISAQPYLGYFTYRLTSTGTQKNVPKNKVPIFKNLSLLLLLLFLLKSWSVVGLWVFKFHFRKFYLWPLGVSRQTVVSECFSCDMIASHVIWLLLMWYDSWYVRRFIQKTFFF